MKKKLLLMFIMLTTAFPVFAEKTANPVDCGVLSEITRPLFHIIMIAAPILLIVMSAVDIFGVVSSSDEKNMKKCLNTMFKRFIICIIIPSCIILRDNSPRSIFSIFYRNILFT